MHEKPNTETVADIAMLNDRRCEFEKIQIQRSALAEQIEHDERAANAAEAEAVAARTEFRQALRAGQILPGKKLFELKATERAAYTLAEDLRGMAYDRRTEQMRLDISAHEVAARYRQEFNRQLAVRADYLLERAFAAMPVNEFVAALRSQAVLEDCNPASAWHQFPMSGTDTAFEFVFNRACKHLLAMLKDAPDTSQALLPPELTNPIDTSTWRASPLELNKMRADLAERERTGFQPEA